MRHPVSIVTAILGVLGLMVTTVASATALDDANDVLTKLNPIGGAISSLIGQARDAGNTVLQQRLEQFNGILQLAIDRANEVAKMRIQDIDDRITRQMRQLNIYVATDLLQMQSLVHASLQQADRILATNIDRFNSGIANAVCSVDFLTTLPILQVPSTGITTYAQVGDYTELYLPGSCLAKNGDHPEARLVSPSDKNDRGVALSANASLGLLSLQIPNSLIPGSTTPTGFTLYLRFLTGRRLGFLWSTYAEQAVPLHICGALPRLHAHMVVLTNGKAFETTQVPHPDLPFSQNGIRFDHLSSNDGSNNTTKDYTLPAASPIAGWEIDRSPNDYGLIGKMLASKGHWDITRPPPSFPVRLYTNGQDGDAFLNATVAVKLIRTVPKTPCVAPIEWNQPLPYGPKQETDFGPRAVQSIGEECDKAKAVAPPSTEVKATLLDGTGASYGSRYLRPNVPADFLGGTVELTMDENYHLAFIATPSCQQQAVPRVE